MVGGRRRREDGRVGVERPGEERRVGGELLRQRVDGRVAVEAPPLRLVVVVRNRGGTVTAER